MFKQDLGFYLGHERPDAFSGFVDENNLFLTIEIEVGTTPDIGHGLTGYIRDKIIATNIENLNQFDLFISNIIKERNLPSGFSIAVGYLKGNIFYLKTINHGKIYIRRNKTLALLVEGDATASGFINEDDIFVFTFQKFMSLIGGEEELNDRIDHRPIAEIIDEITPELLAKDDQGAAALFIQLKKISEEQKPADSFFEKPKINIPNLNSLKDYYQRFGQQKTLTFISVFILAIILFWSVGLGYIRRTSENNQKKISLTRDLISQKLEAAEQVSYLNISSAMSLIAESKDEVKKLQAEIGDKGKEINELNKMISDSENKILKKDEKSFTEFFDLTVDDKNAKGNKLSLDGNNLLILDNNQTTLYTLSLDKKSLDKVKQSGLRKASLIALDGDKKYFYLEGAGIYQATAGEVKKLIENDKEWGKIINLAVFNGNIYLLDKGKNQIWKYLSVDSGFGAKVPYFKDGQSINLSDINSLAVDGSMFLAGNSVFFKYTSGLQDSFKTNLPDNNVNIDKIYTDKNIEKVYSWDRSRGTIYIMGKNGDYQEQINSKILSSGSDFIVYKNVIYLIQGSKIYTIE